MVDKRFNIISKQFKKIRLSKNLSYSDICNKLDSIGISMSENDIKDIENNKREVKDYELIALSIILDIPLDYFIKNFQTFL